MFGTCGTTIDPPDLAAWAAAPTFAPTTIESPELDVIAHMRAFSLANSGKLLDQVGPCAPSFEGGTGDGDYRGECWMAPGTTAAAPLPTACEPPSFEGGGCDTSHGATSGLLAVALAFGLALARRAAVPVCALLLAHTASAADVIAPVSLEPGPWRFVHATPTYTPWALNARLDGAWRARSVVVVYPNHSRAPLLNGLGSASASVGLDVMRVVRLSLGLPVFVARLGKGQDGVDPTLVPPEVSPGDFSLQLSGRLLRTPKDHTALQLVVRADVATAPRTPWTTGTSFAADLTWRQTAGPISVSAQAGVLTARSDAPTALTWAGGATAVWRWLEVTGEVTGQVGFVDAGANDGRLVAAPWSPIEGAFSLGLTPTRGLTLRPFAGAGLNHGLGAPSWDVGLSVDLLGHAPEDLDHDGIVNVRDRCPRRPEDTDRFEDTDGCPDPDNDQDTLLDAVDTCPNTPEDLDGDADADGCPERRVWLALTVAPEDPTLAESTVVEVDGRVVARLGEESRSRTELDARAHRLVVRVTGHAPWSLDLDPVEGGPLGEDITVPVTAMPELVHFGTLRVLLVDAEGAPVVGQVELDDTTHGDVSADGWTGPVAAGHRRLQATATGFNPRSVELDVARDAVTTATVTLERATVWLDDGSVRLDHTLRFPLDATRPVDDDLPMLDALAALLRDHPELRLVRVEGHADSPGTSRHNYDLSLARARAVVDALVARGVDAARLLAVGAGEAARTDGEPHRTVEFMVLVWDDEGR